MSLVSNRASLLRAVREFFFSKNITEVDTPMLSPFAPIDRHIDVMQTENNFLHTSPEYAMKKLLARGSGDIYQLSHVFRKNERGTKHAPEFTMIEWYRLGFTFEQMIKETVDLVELFVGEKKWNRLTYAEALDGHKPTELNWHDHVEPKLLSHIITHFPKSEAALAKTNGEHALRFEVYVDGLELANGYDELACSKTLQARFIESGLDLPIDEELLSCLDDLPDCCGVAVGFDRLMMLKNKSQSINEVLYAQPCTIG